MIRKICLEWAGALLIAGPLTFMVEANYPDGSWQEWACIGFAAICCGAGINLIQKAIK